MRKTKHGWYIPGKRKIGKTRQVSKAEADLMHVLDLAFGTIDPKDTCNNPMNCVQCLNEFNEIKNSLKKWTQISFVNDLNDIYPWHAK